MLLDSTNFGDRLLSLVSVAMPLDGCCFYRVVDGQAVHHRLSGLSDYWLNKYKSYFWRFDPLHPERMAGTGIRVCTFARSDRPASGGEREYVAGFLAPQDTHFQAELYFRRGSAIVAGASLVRGRDRGGFTDDNLLLLDQLVGFTGFGAPEGADDAGGAGPGWLGRTGLSPKEREVAMLVGVALPNKEISRRLGIALPTVKTHVGRLLLKSGVRTRAEFVQLFTRQSESAAEFMTAEVTAAGRGAATLV